MDAALADEAEAAGRLAFGAVTLRVGHDGIGAVVSRDLGLRRREAHRQADVREA